MQWERLTLKTDGKPCSDAGRSILADRKGGPMSNQDLLGLFSLAADIFWWLRR